ncbi:hypothetical protein [Sandarakinorhabdus sp. DWP1-3-1]|uniref:hypothetical protein n=1 Tax=Sandarakinorhabdus sp. DWP1-3-1 TaxID=2804627 RepID=UPI003CF7C31D
MKMLIGGLAAAFMATAALAQTPPADPMAGSPSTTTGPTNPSTSPMTPGSPSSTMTPTDPATGAPADSMSSAGTANTTAAMAPSLTKKNGKWWNGDRRATKDEIAQYQRANPQ